MKKVLRYQDEKSDKFWRIETLENELVVNYGKWESTGKTTIKSFESTEKCEKEARKLVSSKIKKGYTETNNFNELAHKYMDIEDYSPHILASHPIFRKYFTDKIYYDCSDEFTPFGNDNGNDVMWILSERYRKYPRYNINSFVEALIKREWGMVYLPPVPNVSDEELLQEAKQDFNGMSGEELMNLCDQVIIATVFGSIKNAGKITENYAYLAMLSFARMEQMERVLWNDRGYNISKYTDIMRRDLKVYVDNEFLNKPIVWEKRKGGIAVNWRHWREQIIQELPAYVMLKGLKTEELHGISEQDKEKAVMDRMNFIFRQNMDFLKKDKISAETVGKVFGGEYILHTLGNVKFPTGCIVAADPICYMQNSKNITFSKKDIPVGEYPLEIAISDTEMMGKRIMGVRLKIRESKTVSYAPLAVYYEENGTQKDTFSGFPVETGLATICDRSAAEAYWRFLDKWYKENPDGNLYDDYFAESFAESYQKFPNLQREGGDFILWTVPETELNIPMFAAGLGDGFYICWCGYDNDDEMTELTEIFINPEIK